MSKITPVEELQMEKNDEILVQPSKKEKFNIFLNITKEVLLNSTSHGLPNILRNERVVIKFVWGIFLVTSTALCSYLCIQSIWPIKIMMSQQRLEGFTRARLCFQQLQSVLNKHTALILGLCF